MPRKTPAKRRVPVRRKVARLTSLEQRLADAERRIAALEAAQPNRLEPSAPWTPAAPASQPHWDEPRPNYAPIIPPADPYHPLRVTCANTAVGSSETALVHPSADHACHEKAWRGAEL